MDAIRIQETQNVFRVTGDARASTILEAYAYSNAVRRGFIAAHGPKGPNGPPVWCYASGARLYETDKPEAHARELLSSYLSLLAHGLAAWQESIDVRADPTVLDTIDLTEGQAFGLWRAKYQASINESKKVLEERQDTGQFIQCRKCKSNDVDTEQKQTRSADEPMTLFCRCRRCETRFVMR